MKTIGTPVGCRRDPAWFRIARRGRRGCRWRSRPSLKDGLHWRDLMSRSEWDRWIPVCPRHPQTQSTRMRRHGMTIDRGCRFGSCTVPECVRILNVSSSVSEKLFCRNGRTHQDGALHFGEHCGLDKTRRWVRCEQQA